MLVFTASGTGAFESAVVNLLSPGERVLAVSQGEFGERWQALATAFGCDVVPLTYAWGEAPRPDDLSVCARRERGAHGRSSSTPRPPPGSSATWSRSLAVCADAGALSVVDAVSSLGAVPLETDAWGADVVVTGSQKALMTPPGLGVRGRLRARAGSAPRPRRCPASTGTGGASGRSRRRARPRSRPPRRPSWRSTEALGLVLADGLEAAFARHRALGRACRAGVKAIGLELYSPDDDSAAVLTGALTPEGIDAVALRLALRDKHAITIAGGHGDLVARLFRIGHIGHVTVEQIAEALDRDRGGARAPPARTSSPATRRPRRSRHSEPPRPLENR